MRRLMTQPDLPGYGPYINREDYEEKTEQRRVYEEAREQAEERKWEEKKDYGWSEDVLNYLKAKAEVPTYD